MISILIALLVFGLIVFFHELGHFLLAKKNHITVTEFSVGMGPRLCSFTAGETKYSLKLLPIGGSCAMLGEDEEREEEGAFNQKGVWARISVVLAGPVFNFILAFLLSIIVIGAVGYDKAELLEIVPGSPAEEAGLQAGDVIVSLNKHKIHFARELNSTLQFYPLGENTVLVRYQREGETLETQVTPALSEDGVYKIGISYNPGYRQKTSPFNTIKYSFYEVKYWIKTTVKSVGMLIAGKVGAKNISGPVGIVGMIGDTYETSKEEGGIGYALLSLLNLSILLSANLGVMNLLPIPALDGGRLLFLLLEVVRGKPVDQKKEGLVHLIGFVILLLLIAFLVVNDVMKLIGG